MKIIARHKWVAGCTITESHDDAKDAQGLTAYRRFTATIRGYRGWKIYEGRLENITIKKIQSIVRHIRQRIDVDDESVFEHRFEYWIDGR